MSLDERIHQQLSILIKDEDVVDYIQNALIDTDNVEDFISIALPYFTEMDDVASSEEDATDFCRSIFSMKTDYTNEPEIHIKEPIIMAKIMEDHITDPFLEENRAKARLAVTEVGHVKDLEDTVESKFYQKKFKKESVRISNESEKRLELVDKELERFKKAGGYIRPKDRKPRSIELRNIEVYIGSRTLIKDSSLNLEPGNRYGLCGRNGLGKTTFMRYVNSSLIKGVPDDLLIVHVEQEAPISDETVFQTVLNCDLERTELMKLISDSKDVSPDVLNRLHEIGAYDAEVRARMILLALGFSPDMLEMPISSCSGGFRMRVALAQALYIAPDVLMLDEPTGHLDAPSICWLEEFLTTQCKNQIILVISHDRAFLDNVCTHIVHLKDKHLDVYKGNYSVFVKKFEDKVQQIEQQNDAIQKSIDHKMEFYIKNSAKAATAKMAQSRLKSIEKEKKEIIAPIKRDPPIVFKFPLKTRPFQKHIFILDGVSFQYNASKIIFDNLTFNISEDIRAVILGPNGQGKSTFINLLLGKIKPLDGFFQVCNNIKIGYFSQHHIDQLDYRTTPLEHLIKKYKNVYSINELRARLDMFGIDSSLVLQPIKSLSGGQKTRVILADISLTEPHVMLLDEVTNNLDMDSIEALGVALKSYTGAIIAVTHDQHFSDLIGAELYICENKTIRKFEGTFQEYRDAIKNDVKEKYFKKATQFK